MTAQQLVVHYAARWGFRVRRRDESFEDYRAALIPFLEGKDWAAAREVTLGKVQAEWSPEEVQAFNEHLVHNKRMPSADLPDGTTITLYEIGDWPATEDGVRELGLRAIEIFKKDRDESPERELVPIANVITPDGQGYAAPCHRDTRLGVLTYLAKHLGAYGFVLTFDAFMHEINQGTGTATKLDTIIVHMGTRDLRVMLRLPYRVVGGRVEWLELQTLDLRRMPPNSGVVDPYAELFVSTPPTTRPQ